MYAIDTTSAYLRCKVIISINICAGNIFHESNWKWISCSPTKLEVLTNILDSKNQMLSMLTFKNIDQKNIVT
jgi:hypothetical protein